MLVKLNLIKSLMNHTQRLTYKGQCQFSGKNLAPLSKDTLSYNESLTSDLMKLPEKEIIGACQRALKKENIIGEGQEALVYKIEEFPEYCIRQEKKCVGKEENFKLNRNLNNYDVVNHVVCKLDEGTQIMKWIRGIPLKIIPHRDTPEGIELKKVTQAYVANKFGELPFKKVLAQIEDARSKGIVFDRKGENLHVDALGQEMICLDFSPNFKDIEYNPISYVYSALDVDNTEHAPKVFGKLCKAYAQRIVDNPASTLNLDKLDTNFYHRGFIDDPFNYFPDKKILDETQHRIETLLKEKQDPSSNKDYMQYLVDEFKEFINDNVMDLQKPSPLSYCFD